MTVEEKVLAVLDKHNTPLKGKEISKLVGVSHYGEGRPILYKLEKNGKIYARYFTTAREFMSPSTAIKTICDELLELNRQLSKGEIENSYTTPTIDMIFDQLRLLKKFLREGKYSEIK
jgi:hypothetical protein